MISATQTAVAFIFPPNANGSHKTNSLFIKFSKNCAIVFEMIWKIFIFQLVNYLCSFPNRHWLFLIRRNLFFVSFHVLKELQLFISVSLSLSLSENLCSLNLMISLFLNKCCTASNPWGNWPLQTQSHQCQYCKFLFTISIRNRWFFCFVSFCI